MKGTRPALAERATVKGRVVKEVSRLLSHLDLMVEAGTAAI
jgi:hypothetical protein